MPFYDRQTLVTTTDLAAVAAFAHIGADGTVHLMPVTPVLLDGDPAFTLSYARLELAQEVSASPRAALVYTDSRLAYVGWNPLAVTARAQVIPDPQGELFAAELLHQELRKFPPDRQLVDSLILQRENWWYMPRIIVRLTEIGHPRPVARRETPDHAILAYASGGELATTTVRVEDWDAECIPVEMLESGLLPSEHSPAALLYHDFAVPDMESQTTFLAVGRLENGGLRVRNRAGSRTLGKRPGLLTRWRNHQDLKRRCRTGIEKFN